MSQLWPQYDKGGDLPSDLASVRLQPLSQPSLDTIDSPYTPQSEIIDTNGPPCDFECTSAVGWLDPCPLTCQPLLPTSSPDSLLGPDLFQVSSPLELDLASPTDYLASHGSSITTPGTNQEASPSFPQTAWDRQGTFSSLTSMMENVTRDLPIRRLATADEAASISTGDCVTEGAQHWPVNHHHNNSSSIRPQMQALIGGRQDHAADQTHGSLCPKPRRRDGPTYRITAAAPAMEHSQEQALLIPQDSDYNLALTPLQPVPLGLLGETAADYEGLAFQGEESLDYTLLQNVLPLHINFSEEGSSFACHTHSSCPTPDYTTSYSSPTFTNGMTTQWGQYRDTTAFITAGLLNGLDQEPHMTQTGQPDKNISYMCPFSSSSSSSSSSNEDSNSLPSILPTERGQHGGPSSMDGIYNALSSNTLSPTALKVVTSGSKTGDDSDSSSDPDSKRPQQKKRARLPNIAYSSMTKQELEKRRRELNNQCCRENRGRRRERQQIQEQECKQLQEHNAALRLQMSKLMRKKEVLSKLSERMDMMHFTRQ